MAPGLQHFIANFRAFLHKKPPKPPGSNCLKLSGSDWFVCLMCSPTMFICYTKQQKIWSFRCGEIEFSIFLSCGDFIRVLTQGGGTLSGSVAMQPCELGPKTFLGILYRSSSITYVKSSENGDTSLSHLPHYLRNSLLSIFIVKNLFWEKCKTKDKGLYAYLLSFKILKKTYMVRISIKF